MLKPSTTATTWATGAEVQHLVGITAGEVCHGTAAGTGARHVEGTTCTIAHPSNPEVGTGETVEAEEVGATSTITAGTGAEERTEGRTEERNDARNDRDAIVAHNSRDVTD